MERVISSSWSPAVPESPLLRRLVVGAGLGWSVLFVTVGLAVDLHAYGDGSIFAYAVAVRDAWAVHWHNIPGRLFTYVVAYLPAEAVGGLAGARAAITLYGLVFFAAPLLGLLATWAADRSRGRTVFVTACLSTALLCPLVFGFPTEMWMAHAVFWPALAVCHDAPNSPWGTAAVVVALLALVFTHEGAVVLAAAIVATLAVHGRRDAILMRGVVALSAVMAVWLVVKLTVRPDDYIAAVLAAAAFRFVDPRNLADPVVALLVATPALYGTCVVLLRRTRPAVGVIGAILATAAALALYWLAFDRSLVADDRYKLRTTLLIATPVLGGLAVLRATADDDRLAPRLAVFARAAGSVRHRIGAPVLAGGFALLMLVHAVETTKFVLGWRDYTAGVRALATGEAADRDLGDPDFVSARRIGAAADRLSWNSTTPYLSVLVAPDFAPTRLVVDPTASYFWLSCATATRNAQQSGSVPAASRDLVRRLACLHR